MIDHKTELASILSQQISPWPASSFDKLIRSSRKNRQSLAVGLWFRLLSPYMARPRVLRVRYTEAGKACLLWAKSGFLSVILDKKIISVCFIDEYVIVPGFVCFVVFAC